ncbi:MAG: GNAT family N-acetyltransferase [Chloroflexi bacterium]|nr:GNAT family N-acetyltransferase [Chloroflexota bacterium]
MTPFQTYDIRKLDGFAAVDDCRVVGIATYAIKGPRCEIVTINAFVQCRGVGTALVDAAMSTAIDGGCTRLTLFTTNDNLNAQRFYTRRWFRMATFYPDAMDAVRRIKPGVPATGAHGIPLRDMIEFDMDLKSGGAIRTDVYQAK